MHTRSWLGLVLGVGMCGSAWAHSVAQVQTTARLAPETVTMLQDRAQSSNPGDFPGFRNGDTLSYIIQFTPVPNGATLGPNAYVTAYLPPDMLLVDAAILLPAGVDQFITVAPNLPGPMSNGWGPRGQQIYISAPWNTTFDPVCVGGQCNGSMAMHYADTGIFYSQDIRTAVFPGPTARILQGANGYNIDPTGSGKLNTMLFQTAATTHNLWDADQVNAFGSKQADINALAVPKSAATAAGVGKGAAPWNAASAVAGPQTGYQNDDRNIVGPWQRIAYFGSRVGSNTEGPATSQTTSATAIIDDDFAIVGSFTQGGLDLNATQLTTGTQVGQTNAVRWALGRIEVGKLRYVKFTVRLTADPPATGIVMNSEVFGGDSAQTPVEKGQDNVWRYHVPSVASHNSNLFVLIQPVAVNGMPSDGATIPATVTTITYRMTYLNSGSEAQTNVTFLGTLPTQLQGTISTVVLVNGDDITTTITPASPGAGADYNFAPIASLAPGAFGAVTFDVNVVGGAVGDVVSHRFVMSSDQTQMTSTALSIVGDTAILNISIVAKTPTGIKGDPISYTLRVTNTGVADASQIVVTDFLPTVDFSSPGALNANTHFSLVPNSSVFTGATGVTPVVTTPPDQSPYIGFNQEQVTWDLGAQTLVPGASLSIDFDVLAGIDVPAGQSYSHSSKVTYNNGQWATEAAIYGTAFVALTCPTGFDGAQCDVCAAGFYGPSCTPCPGGAVNPCSGNGTCNEGLTGDGVCVCTANFTGNDCSTCDAGFYGATCSSECPGGAINPCSGNGTCDDGITGTGVCVCTADFTGNDCSTPVVPTCAAGFYGPSCTPCPGGAVNPCSGNGTCDDGITGTGVCVCTADFTGNDCSTPVVVDGGGGGNSNNAGTDNGSTSPEDTGAGASLVGGGCDCNSSHPSWVIGVLAFILVGRRRLRQRL